MTRRKPADESFEDWTERQIREAQARGAFDDLPGAGKPIPDLDRPWSAERWVADLARREGIDLSVTLPTSLRLRRERETLLAGLPTLTSEAQVRAAVQAFNDEVREAFRRPSTGGPPMTVGLMDVDTVLERWRSTRPSPPAGGLVVDVANVLGSRPDGWWRNRVGATQRLLDRLAAARLGEQDGPTPGPVVAVVEGRAAAVTDVEGLVVVRAAGSGDDEVVVQAVARPAATVVTADRGLRARLPEGTPVWGPGRLLELLPG